MLKAIQEISQEENKVRFEDFVARQATLVSYEYDDEYIGTSVRLVNSDLKCLCDAVEGVYQAAVQDRVDNVVYNPYEMMIEIVRDHYYEDIGKDVRKLGDKNKEFMDSLNDDLSRHLQHYGYAGCKIILEDVTTSTLNVCKKLIVNDTRIVLSRRDPHNSASFRKYFNEIGQAFLDKTDIMEGLTNLYTLYINQYRQKDFAKLRFRQEEIAKDVASIAQATLEEFKKYNPELVVGTNSVDLMADIYAKYIYDSFKEMLYIQKQQNLSKLSRK